MIWIIIGIVAFSVVAGIIWARAEMGTSNNRSHYSYEPRSGGLDLFDWLFLAWLFKDSDDD